MSKIGRKPIAVGNVKVEIKGNVVHYKGNKASGEYEVSDFITLTLDDNKLLLMCDNCTKDQNRWWGMHRALLANALKGADAGFEKTLHIEGLGYKAVLSGNKITLTLGYSHKIDVELPKDVELKLDKQGKVLTFSSYDKGLVGEICDRIRSLRPPEPYKGTGVRISDEVVFRKAGKAKGA